MPQEDMAPTSSASSARSESVLISRPSPSKPRLIPYVEIPVYRGGLASRGSTPASRAPSVNLNGHGGLKRKEPDVGAVETPPAKRPRKPRVPGPPITLVSRTSAPSSRNPACLLGYNAQLTASPIISPTLDTRVSGGESSVSRCLSSQTRLKALAKHPTKHRSTRNAIPLQSTRPPNKSNTTSKAELFVTRGGGL